MRVKILSDSVCDLSKGSEKYNIDLVPMPIIKDDVTYKDGVDITRKIFSSM